MRHFPSSLFRTILLIDASPLHHFSRVLKLFPVPCVIQHFGGPTFCSSFSRCLRPFASSLCAPRPTLAHFAWQFCHFLISSLIDIHCDLLFLQVNLFPLLCHLACGKGSSDRRWSLFFQNFLFPRSSNRSNQRGEPEKCLTKSFWKWLGSTNKQEKE